MILNSHGKAAYHWILRDMLDKLLTDVSRLCAVIPAFGEVLDKIRKQRNWSQKQLGVYIFRSEAETNRLINNQIPSKMVVGDVHEMAKHINCNREELAALVESFVCHLLSTREIIDLDLF